MPDKKLFRDQEVDPSASVHVTLKPGDGLSPKQVSAIRHLVAGAVEKLSPSQVTIVDESGALIGGPRDPELDAADGAFEHQRRYERQLEEKITELLEPVVGVGAVKAKVSARIDYSHVVETEDRIDPNEQAVLSEQNTEEQRSSGETAALGVPGMASNTPDRNPGAGAGGVANGQSNRTENTTNYQNSRVSRRTEQPRGRPMQLSVAVIVDNARKVDEAGVVTPIPRSAEELERFKALVSNAVGIDAERGDSIEVVAETMLRPNEGTSADAGLVEEPTSNKLLLYGVVGGAALLLVGGALFAMRSRNKARAEQLALERMRIEALQQENLPQLEAPAQLSASVQVDALRQRALSSGQDDIRRTATVIRGWLGEDAGAKRQGA
jgi:flagellar M-ring protein FliF